MGHRPDPPSTDVSVTARQNTVNPQSSALHVNNIADCDHVAVAHHGRGICTPSIAQSTSFGQSSRTNSSSSLLPGMARPGSSASSSHQHQVRYERRPSLRQNPAWQGSFSSAQPATDPPTPASSRLILRSDKFPWPVVVGLSLSSSGYSSGSGYGGSLGHSRSRSSSNISNLDLLYALHATLLVRVTPQEWEALGHGSRAQRKVTRAYEKRCTKMGGGWEGGVRRLDWLHGKTRLVGIEVEKHGNGANTGKLVFGKP